MRLRFETSVGGASYSFIEGQIITVNDPVDDFILDWLNRGVVTVVKDDGDPERAVLLQRRPYRARRATPVAGQHGRLSGRRTEPDA